MRAHRFLLTALTLVVIFYKIPLMAETKTNSDEKLIPVVVTGKVEPVMIKQGEPIPLTVAVANDLKGTIRYFTYSLEPNDWNGETAGVTLVDVYRDGKPGGLFAQRPKIAVPAVIAGMSSHRINAGASLTIKTDARKWNINGGWVPGKYTANVRIENLHVDGDRCTLSILSKPFEFEIR